MCRVACKIEGAYLTSPCLIVIVIHHYYRKRQKRFHTRKLLFEYIREPPDESQKAIRIDSSPEMINVLLGDVSEGGQWPVEFAPENPEVGVISVEESEWSWTEPEVPGREMVVVPYDLVEDNAKIEYGKYNGWIAINQIRIGNETYIPSEKLRPCSHPPEHIDTVVLNESFGAGVKWFNFSSSGDTERLLCKKCKTPL